MSLVCNTAPSTNSCISFSTRLLVATATSHFRRRPQRELLGSSCFLVPPLTWTGTSCFQYPPAHRMHFRSSRIQGIVRVNTRELRTQTEQLQGKITTQLFSFLQSWLCPWRGTQQQYRHAAEVLRSLHKRGIDHSIRVVIPRWELRFSEPQRLSGRLSSSSK